MKIIASWGSSGAGKTTLALAVAAALAHRKQNVCVISADTRTPALPIYLPNDRTLSSRNSIGALFDWNSGVSESALKDKLCPHPKSERICFLGLAPGELIGITYRVPERQAVMSLLQTLSNGAIDTVIIDCDSSPIGEPLTLFALEQAQTVLRVVTPTVKGYEFQQAQTAWMKNNDIFHIDRHIKVANQVFPHTPLQEAVSRFDGFDFMLPYASGVSNYMEGGQLLRSFKDTEAMRFEHVVERLVTTISEEVTE